MTEADAEDGHPAPGQLDEVDEAARLMGRARPRESTRTASPSQASISCMMRLACRLLR